MDDEELDLGTTGKKITVNNFFESIRDIDQVASDATKSILRQGVTIEGIIKSIAKIEKEIIEIKSFIRIQKDLEEDRLLEAQDAEQKERRRLELESEFGGEENKEKKSRKDQNAPGDFGLNAREKAAAAITAGGGSALGGIGLQLPSLIKGLFGFAEGGKVNDTDNDKTNNNEDSVPAMLTPGEFVITKDAVKKIGVNTLKGINAAAGGTNKPKPLGKAEDLGSFSIGRLDPNAIGDDALIKKGSSMNDKREVEISNKSGTNYFKKTTDTSGGGIDQETVSRKTITEGGTVLTINQKMKEKIVSVGVPDLIEHKTQLLGEIHKLDGFEKVTIDDVINQTTGIPQDKLFEIINKSDAAKATEKKQEDAIKEDYKARDIKPGKGFSMSHDDEVAKSLQGTMGYRIGQINPDQLVISMDQLIEKSTQTYNSADDPKFKEAHANAKGAKAYSEGGLVTKGSGNFTDILSGLQNLTKSPIANMLKDVADNDKLGLENIANEVGKNVDPKGVAKSVTNTVFQKLTGMEDIDIFDSLIPLIEEVQSAEEGDAPPSTSESPNKNAPVLIQKSAPNVSEATIKNSSVEEAIPFINAIINKELSTLSNQGLANFIK
tara:strand:+ start:223 stop:2040 length:1818 start_codon:yes stop_codon:yes gene_type:complete